MTMFPLVPVHFVWPSPFLFWIRKKNGANSKSHWWKPNQKGLWCWERLRAGEGGGEDETVGWHHWFNGHEFEQLQEIVKDREAWHAAGPGVAKSHIWLSNWTTTTAHLRTGGSFARLPHFFTHLLMEQWHIECSYSRSYYAEGRWTYKGISTSV